MAVTEVLIAFAAEGEQASDAALDTLSGGWLTEIYNAGEFRGKPCEHALLHRPSGTTAKRLAVIGAGKREKFNAAEARKAVGTIVRALKCKGLRELTLWLPEEWSTGAEMVQASVEGALLGDFEPDALKTDEKKAEKRLTGFWVLAASIGEEMQVALHRGRILGEAANITRELQNEPSNVLTPLVLADRAREIAAKTSLEIEIYDEARMKQLGMGSLLGVSMGSDNPPAFIILRYTPKHATSQDHLAIVGKAVTFDSGGISIKPADGMDKMKYDMSGGAAAIGAMHAIAQLQPPVRVTAYIPSVENMVSGRAQRPGDIVRSLKGKTVEVLNTDAEGRLILIDALTLGLRQGCTHIVDAATLTGAIVVALAHVRMGAFTNDEALLDRVRQAGEAAGERLWHMPLDDDYKEYIKSAFADLPNIGGRYGGAITAAKFLQEFVDEKPWVHLDIAGVAWLDDAKPWMAKGPTSAPMRTFVNLALGWGV